MNGYETKRDLYREREILIALQSVHKMQKQQQQRENDMVDMNLLY